MLILTETTDNLQVVLGGAVTTNQLRCVTSWRDTTTTTFAPGRTVTNTNNTTDVNIVPAPASSTQRIVDFIGIYNADTVAATVTVKFDANGTEYVLASVPLGIGERLEYTSERGFQAFDTFGRAKVLQTTQSSLTGDTQVLILGSNVTNNNAVANTMQDVTGLSFPVVANEVYWFKFDILYTAAATTTGSRWSINGPAAPTRLVYMSEYSLTSTTSTRNANLTAYDLPAASNATSGTTGSNRAEIEGVIQPSASGTVIARFASEVASSAIVALAGSRVQWMRTV